MRNPTPLDSLIQAELAKGSDAEGIALAINGSGLVRPRHVAMLSKAVQAAMDMQPPVLGLSKAQRIADSIIGE